MLDFRILFRDNLTPTLQRATNLARERGSSSWLTSLPSRNMASAFIRVLLLMPLPWKKGGLPLEPPRHVRVGPASVLNMCYLTQREVSRLSAIMSSGGVRVEHYVKDRLYVPPQKPFTAISRRAQSVVFVVCLVITSVIGCNVGSTQTSLQTSVSRDAVRSLQQEHINWKCFKKHEQEKKRAYEQRILDVEHASFTPLVFSASGGLGKEATTFYKRLASLLAYQWDQPYSTTMNWLICTLSFCLLWSSIQCMCGAHSSIGRFGKAVSRVDLVSTETNFLSC